MIDLSLITQTGELSAIAHLLKDNGHIAVDTEFMRRTTYYPKLALLQMHGSQGSFLVDPLGAELSLEPLKRLMNEGPVTKVFHAASQDLEIFYHVWGALPEPFMDTQVMVMFLGHEDNMGYQALCETFLGVTVSKAHQEINWLKRPLSVAQKLYAAQDVSLLYEIYLLLKERLGERYDWVVEDMQAYREGLTFEADALRTWRRFNKPRGWEETANLRLIQVVLWRDVLARRKNLIGRLILPDEECVEVTTSLLAGRDPQSRGAQRYLRELKSLFSLPVGEEAQSLWEQMRLRSPTPDKKRQDALKALCAEVASQHGLLPGLVGRGKDIEAYLLGRPSRLTQGWRRGLLGDRLP